MKSLGEKPGNEFSYKLFDNKVRGCNGVYAYDDAIEVGIALRCPEFSGLFYQMI